MNHSKTIAIARGVLAEGRLSDAERMIDPLLDDTTSVDPEPGQLMLRCLKARIALLRRGDHRTAYELLRPYDASDRRASLESGLRAEIALWLGWASAWQEDDLYDDARALNLLDAAGQAFEKEVNPSGQCWALLGQAQAYFTIDEHGLMVQALRDASMLLHKLEDVYAEAWLHHLSAIGARLEGRYRTASSHADELERIADAMGDGLALGRALAHRAIIQYESGRKPEEICETALRAERLLERASTHGSHALLMALHARTGALIRQGRWDEAENVIVAGLKSTRDVGSSREMLTVHRARIAMRRGDDPAARTLLEQAAGRIHRRRRLLHTLVERERSCRALSAGRPEEARRHVEQALHHARDADHTGCHLLALLQQAEVEIAAGREGPAREAMRLAEEHTDYFSLLPVAARRFFVHGLLSELRERPEEARAAFAQALSAYSLIGDVYAAARTQVYLAALRSTHVAGESRSLAKTALETFESLGAQREAERARKVLDREAEQASVVLDPGEAAIGSVLARSALSVELVAESWLQAAEELAPGRWLVVFRCGGPGSWTLIHRHGNVSSDLHYPDPSADRVCGDGVDWIRLRGLPAPAFFFGMECGGDDDPACAAIERKLMPWIPVVGLALEHALLRSDRLANVSNGGGDASLALDVEGFIYTSPGMRSVAHQITRVRNGHSPVLISGEPGVGKSVVARTIHDSGDRHDAPFIPFNASSIARADVETALFGRDGKVGALHAAHRGTLYLNNVGELPVDVQPRLLHFIERGHVDRSHGDEEELDVRVLASTGVDLKERVREGGFLEDLYYRLNVVHIHVPPLRERREEIPLLVHHFLEDLTHGRSGSASVTSRALDALIKYDWPGNVRQLRNEIERLLVYAATEPVSTIDVDDLSESIRRGSSGDAVSMEADGSLDGVALNGRGLDEIMANAERSVIEQVLNRHDGQVSSSAEALGLSRQGLYKKMKRLGIDASSVAQR
ncbi:MAG: sigma 54-interacting transcriptional regulator [Rhodothermales bacterium]